MLNDTNPVSIDEIAVTDTKELDDGPSTKNFYTP